MQHLRATIALTTTLVGALSLSSCGDPNAMAAKAAPDYPTRLVLADQDSGSGFHPATGYGQVGVSPIYDGLLRPTPSGQGELPTFEPALAQELPTSNADLTEWTISLKSGITFTDGSEFDAADVKASYETALDTANGSEIAGSYAAIKTINTPDPHTVVFELRYPLSDINARLTYPIAPSELLGDQPISASELNSHPVGTGAYQLVEHRGDETILKANEHYWDGPSPISELVITTATDDAARAHRVVAGEFDGAVIPQNQAAAFLDNPNVQVDVAKGADWRGISLPSTPALQDPTVRQALNLAADRQGLVDGPLTGYGEPASNPITARYGAAYNPDATFAYDRAAAERLLDEAGWHKNAAGQREKNGEKFHEVLFYPGDDSGRRDIAIEFAAQMKTMGLEFETKAGTWDEITPQLAQVAVVLGGGETPYDPEMAAYDYLHTRTETTSPYHNPGNFGSPELDEVLAQIRQEADLEQREILWHQAQELYADNPSMLMLATVDHVYLSRPNAWKKPELLLEPHIHGATWGPWWRVSQWHQ